MDAEPLIRLTAEIKNDLIRKLDLYLNRSEEERDKILVFTDDPTLWTEYSNPSIRLDTLPPIPEDYQLRPGYDIVREMNTFLKRYCTLKKYVLCWCLSVRGEDDNKPEVHVLFYDDIKTPEDMIPIYSSDNVLHSDRPREHAPYCPPSALPAAVKAEMWREHHQDSTLNDVSSSIFSMSFPGDSSSGKGQKPIIRYLDGTFRRSSSTDSQATMPPDDPTLGLRHDDEVSTPSDYASGPSTTGSSKDPGTVSTADFSTGSSPASASKLGDPK